MSLRDRLVDPNSADRRPRKAAYALPTFFTAANIFLGFLAVLKAVEGAMAASRGDAMASSHLSFSAILIGVSIFCDGLDGRIARLTNTTSDFGRELDSLADVISFGIAPAILAFVWGFQFMDAATPEPLRHYITQTGYFVVFTFLLCGAARLARFNITTNPMPRNPGRPDRKYFVGLPIPAGAGMIASVVYWFEGQPLRWWPFVVAWLALVGLLSYLMVCTWRYRSFKDMNMMRPRGAFLVVFIGMFIYAIYHFSQITLLTMCTCYVASGILVRIAGIMRRHFFSKPAAVTE